MRVAFSAAAIDDLRAIRAYIGKENPLAAHRLAARIVAACDALAYFPARGRPGLVKGTRELALVAPYVIVYRIAEADIMIVRIWHGAQDRIPPLP